MQDQELPFRPPMTQLKYTTIERAAFCTTSKGTGYQSYILWIPLNYCTTFVIRYCEHDGCISVCIVIYAIVNIGVTAWIYFTTEWWIKYQLTGDRVRYAHDTHICQLKVEKRMTKSEQEVSYARGFLTSACCGTFCMKKSLTNGSGSEWYKTALCVTCNPLLLHLFNTRMFHRWNNLRILLGMRWCHNDQEHQCEEYKLKT